MNLFNLKYHFTMKNHYEAPVVEAIEVEIEKGFQNSPSLENPEDGGTQDW